MPELRRQGVSALVILGATLATLLPTAAGVLEAEQQAKRHELAQIERFANATIGRVGTVVDQANHALVEMNKHNGLPCSAIDLSELRRISAAYRYIHDAGVYDARGYLCSAVMGARSIGELPMPAPDIQQQDGTQIWLDAPSPLGGRRRVIVGRNGYFVSMDKDSLVDTVDLSMRSLAAINTSKGDVFAHSGSLTKQEATDAINAVKSGATLTDTLLIKQSPHLPIAVAVAVPRPRFIENVRTLFSAWALCGAALGMMCGLAVARLLSRSLSFESELARAIDHGQLEVHYQPIVDLDTRLWVGAEALARWRYRGEYVSPDIFIPIAERSDLIQKITSAVLRNIGANLSNYLRKDQHFYVSVNVSSRDLMGDELLNNLRETVRKSKILPKQIRIEATERELLDDSRTESVFQACRTAGHPLYIDDFGTGYASLSYLQRFNVDALKIDKSFVDTIGHHSVTSDVTPHIVAMAKALQTDVVAEGVETTHQAEKLRQFGVKYGQGWLYSKAIRPEELVYYLKNKNCKRS